MNKSTNPIDRFTQLQGIAILLTAISVFDFGYSTYVENGIWFNYVLFESRDPSFIQKSTFWDIFQFWGYCFFVVGSTQIAKSLPHGFSLRPHRIKFGIISISFFFGAPLLSLLYSADEYNFETNALSSLIDYGWVPTVLMSWGLMISTSTALIYFYFLEIEQRSDRLAILLLISAAIMFFLVGLTLPNDQPFSHNLFGNLPWYCLTLGILIYSFSQREELRSSFYFAIVISFYIIFMLVLWQFGVNLVLWLTQTSFGLLNGIWFIDYEIKKHRLKS
jgi:hypothetical membrane protein